MPYGLSYCENDAFRSILQWLSEKSGISPSNDYCKVVMNCLLSVDTNAYFTNPWNMTPTIRKILARASQACDLFKSTKFIDRELKNQDMFTGEDDIVLYIETPSGIKTDCASEDSWAYHILINGLICPSTREPIVSFYRGRMRALRSQFDYKTLKLPYLFKMDDIDHNNLKYDLHQDIIIENAPFDLTNTLVFESRYGIPQDRAFSYVYLRETYGLHLIDTNEIGTLAAIFVD